MSDRSAQTGSLRSLDSREPALSEVEGRLSPHELCCLARLLLQIHLHIQVVGDEGPGVGCFVY